MGSTGPKKVFRFPAALAATLVLTLVDDGGAARVVERSESVLSFDSALGQTAAFGVDGDGVHLVTVNNSDGSVALKLAVHPAWASKGIDLTADDFGDFELSLSDGGPPSVSIALASVPEGGEVSVDGGGEGQAELSVGVSDPTGDRVGVNLAIDGLGETVEVTITYDVLPEEAAEADAVVVEDESSRVTPLFPGLAEEQALGGSVTLAATGMSVSGVLVVSLAYQTADVAEGEEPNLRLHRFSNAAGAYQPVGSNDRGVGSPTTAVGDFGVDTGAHTVWAVVDQLGSFAVGIPDNTLPSTIDAGDTDSGAEPAGAVVRGPLCGVPGLLGFVATFLSLLALRRVP